MTATTGMIGVCGDDCSHCPRYTATQKNDRAELEKVKELWVRLGFREADFPSQKLECTGCGPDNECACPEVRTCAAGKGIDNCGRCREYPCELISAVFETSEELRSRACQVCAPAEMDALVGAFFSKRKNLDRIHSQRQ